MGVPLRVAAMTDLRGVNKKAGLNRREALRLLLAGASGVAFLTAGGVGSNLQSSLLEAVSAYTGPTYTIQQAGGIVTATPASGSGLKPISGSDAATVIMGACIANAKVLIKTGTYIISRQYGCAIKKNGVELYGEPGTVLKLANGMNTVVLHAPMVSNVNIHDLEIDGNQANQTPSQAVNVSGISIYQVNGGIVQNCYVHDCGCFGINASDSANIQVLNNKVVNSGANSINLGGNVGGTTYPGGGWTVTGNTCNGFSDVGITCWQGTNYTATNNTVLNGLSNTSPFHNNSHVGMMVENSGGNVTYQHNTISNCDGAALAMSGGTTVTFDNNSISICGRGLYAYGGSGLTVTNCTFDQIGTIKRAKLLTGALVMDTGMGPAKITGCQFTNPGQYIQGGSVIQLLSPTGTFSSNVIHTDNGKYKAITDAPSWTITNNTILP